MTQEHFCDMAHDTELDWKFSRFLLGKAETSNKTSSFYIGISPPEERSVQSFYFYFLRGKGPCRSTVIWFMDEVWYW